MNKITEHVVSLDYVVPVTRIIPAALISALDNYTLVIPVYFPSGCPRTFQRACIMEGNPKYLGVMKYNKK